MKLTDVLPAVVARVEAIPGVAPTVVLHVADRAHNQRLAAALRTRGLAVVVAVVSGTPNRANEPRLRLSNHLLVSVVENTATNMTGTGALALTETILAGLHQASLPEQRGIANEFTVDTPAYEAGPADSGLSVYFINLKVQSFQP